MAIGTGLTDIIPLEVSCGRYITLAKNMGIWVESDSYTPKTGDLILYDWDDTGNGDAASGADHIGIVESVSGKTIKVIEGNNGDKVAYRTIRSMAGTFGVLSPPSTAAKPPGQALAPPPRVQLPLCWSTKLGTWCSSPEASTTCPPTLPAVQR